MKKDLFHVLLRDADGRQFPVQGDVRNVQVEGCWCVIDLASGEQITYPYDRIMEIRAVKIDVPDSRQAPDSTGAPPNGDVR